MLLKKDLLAHMKRTHEYTVTHLSQVLRVTPGTVAKMLQELVDEGKLRVSRTTGRGVHYSLVSSGRGMATATDCRSVQAVPASMAAFPVRQNLTGSLSGYDSELDTKRQLALLARDRCR